ncbi:hypothetical protein FB451DRAFT_1422400 [Mycena latifolia]|nr:hypothetical protein FB451DRAFT_1422400 [Mycena latifolia]
MLFLSSRLAARPASSRLCARPVASLVSRVRLSPSVQDVTFLQPMANRLGGALLPAPLPTFSRLGSDRSLTTTALDTGIVFDSLERDRRHEREVWMTERAEWRSERTQLTEKVLQECNKVVLLQRDLIDAQIIAPVLRVNAKNIKIGRGVQAVVDAALDGKFDDPNALTTSGTKGITFAAARADIIRQFGPSGLFPSTLLDMATQVIYHEMSKHMHGSEVDPIEIQEGEHTQAEAMAALTLFLFAARLVGSTVDVQYTSRDKTVQFRISHLV